MSRNHRIQVGEWYHCYNRGVDKRKTFQDETDYERFLSLLYLANDTFAVNMRDMSKGSTFVERFMGQRDEKLIEIAAYCLMPNHYHLLIKEVTEGGVSRFMQKLGTGYTKYFNVRYERTGALFGSRFKSRHVDSDRYFKRVLNYIHANPAELVESGWKHGIISDTSARSSYIQEYRYSSLADYETERVESRILDREKVRELYESFILPSARAVIEESLIFLKEEGPLYKG